jgi:hypothetical protein
MVKVFKYKQKIVPKLIILILMAIFPFLFGLTDAYSSLIYYLIISSLVVINCVYYSSKSLIVTENGIEEKILWNILWQSATWEEMEEAYVITGGGKTSQTSFNTLPGLSTTTEWLERISIGTTVKIIISNHEAIYMKLQDLKNYSELYNILKTKIRFVKN